MAKKKVRSVPQTGRRKSVKADRARKAKAPSSKERRRNRTDAVGSRL